MKIRRATHATLGFVAIYASVALAICSIVTLALAVPFMLAWNYAVCEAIAIARPVSYWQAAVLVALLMPFVQSCGLTSQN